MTIPSFTDISSDADHEFLTNFPLSEPRPCTNREYMRHEIKIGPEDITHKFSQYLLKTCISSSRELVAADSHH